MTTTTLEQRLVHLLRRRLLYYETDQPLDLDRPLTELGLDSLGKVQLILEVEDTFGLLIPESDLTEANFETAGAVLRLLARLAPETGVADG